MAKNNGAPPAVHTAPCVALQLKAASWSSDADEISAFETRAAEAASRFGRVMKTCCALLCFVRQQAVKEFYAARRAQDWARDWRKNKQ